MPTKYRLSQLICHNEGYGIKGAIPTVRNNPGDLKHSNHSSHVGIGPNDIGIIDTVEHGWEDLDRQLEIFAAEGLTLAEMVNVYLGWLKDAPMDDSIVDGNHRAPYLSSLTTGLSLPPEATVAQALLIPPK